LSTTEDKICIKLYSLLREIIRDISSEGLLLSGGVDSSIIASIQKPKFAFTVSLEGKGSDLIYASQIAEKYGSKHIQVKIAYEELTIIEEKIIQLFETFDPIFVRNSSVIFAGIQKASQLGISTLLTGDGGDELFAGYNYLKRYYDDPKKLDIELKRLWEIMHFPSKK
jgi:asparagine synthase (glutamine-hydrolysing)